MEYYTVDKNNYILKFMCKFMDLENIIKEWVNPEPERKIYVLTPKWLLDIKQRTAYNSQCPEHKQQRENRDIHKSILYRT